MSFLSDVSQWAGIQFLFVWALTEQYLHKAWCWLVTRYPGAFAEKVKLIWAKDGDIVKQLEMSGAPVPPTELPQADEYDLSLAIVPVPINPAVVLPTVTHFVVRPVNVLDVPSIIAVPRVAKHVRFYSVTITVQRKDAIDDHDNDVYTIPTISLQLAVVNNKLFDQAFLLWLLSSYAHRDVYPDLETVSVSFVDNTFKVVKLEPDQFIEVHDTEYQIISNERPVFVGQ